MKFKGYQLSIVVLAVHLLSTASGSSKCPNSCRCNKTTVSCVESGLEYVPKFSSLRAPIIFMDLSRNNIEYLDETDFVFPGASQLKALQLYDNSITDVESGCFAKMINLELLDLHDNLIVSLPRSFVQGNKRLRALDLSGNLFMKQTPVIESESLEELDLSSTRLATFSRSNVEFLPNLKVLHLYHNNLQHVAPSAFLNSKDSFYVELSHNDWRCDCETIQLFDEVTMRNQTKIDKIQCKDDADGKYVDIYDENGPIFPENVVCQKEFSEPEEELNINNTAKSEYYQNACAGFFCNSVNNAIVITVSVLSIIILLGIISMVVLLKSKRYENVDVLYEMETTSC